MFAYLKSKSTSGLPVWRSNLDELSKELVSLLSLPLILIGIMLGSATATRMVSPNTPFMLSMAVLALAVAALILHNQYPALTRHLLAWGATVALLVAMSIQPEPWLPLIGLPLVFMNTALVRGAGVVSAGGIGLAAWWLTTLGERAYALPLLLTLLALTTYIALAVAGTLGSALRLAWETEHETDQMLIQARERQANLATVLKSLELTTSLLEQANRRLYVAHRQAEEAQRMKEQFAANVSHELRTPLNLILGFSEMLHLSPEVYGQTQWPPTLRRDIYQIYRSSRHLLEMIDDILDLSRYELAGFTLNKEPTEVEPLLRNAVEITAGLFRDRPVKLELEVAPGLPALNIDRTRIRQVVLNLLSNARRFTEHGVVRVQARQVDNDIVISVCDTGPGVPADKLSHIFEEFYQVDGSLRRSHHGAGLGLAISKHFVQAHEGRIWVESEEGKGSTFYFSLPIPHLGTPTLYPRETRSLPPAWHGTCARASILVIDPDPAVGALIRRHLADCDVFQTEDETHIEGEIITRQPDLIIHNVRPTATSACEGEVSILPVNRTEHSEVETVSPPVLRCSLPSKAWLANELAVATCLSKPITAPQLLKEIERLGPIHDILIVDDDRGFCQLVERMLATSSGAYRVRHAYDGDEGLRAMQEQPPDLLLLDLIMPVLDGFDLLARKEALPQLADIPVIVLSVTSAAEDALARQGSQFSIHRPGGLRLVEVLRCLRAVSEALNPHNGSASAPEALEVSLSDQLQRM